jgi:hypothetical protein
MEGGLPDMSSSSSHNQAPADTGTGTQAGASPRDAGSAYVPRPAPQYDDTRRRSGGHGGAAMGLTLLAAVLMLLSGAWNFLEGLAALVRGAFFFALPHYAYDLSVHSWGLFHLVLGAVVFVAGACLFLDMAWARMVGILLASLSAIINFLYIPYSPVWSIMVIAIDVLVVWALLSPRYRHA